MELKDKILELKRERNAVILAHNYQVPEVQDVADFIGDSLGLSIEASKTAAKVIVFCGVHFMAETAKIVNPDKIVLMPDVSAGCPMANMITPEDVKKLKWENPSAKVVAYVNTSAKVKAESDICCTSANAVDVVRSFKKNEEIIFVPDKYLGMYVQRFVKGKFILWEGYCPIHVGILLEHINKVKDMHPKAEVLVHPECRPEVIDVADKVLSTEGMVKWAKSSTNEEFIIGTEVGILNRLKKDNPNKMFYPASEKAICPNMKKISLEKILWALQDMKEKIEVPGDVAINARKAIDRMLDLSKKD